MIKAIESLKDHPFHDAIMERFNNHPQWSTFCRFTLADLKRLSSIEQRGAMNWGVDAHMAFSNSLSQFERSEISILQRCTRKEKLEGLERRVKSAVQRTERYIQSIRDAVESEEKLKSDWLELQNKRSAAGMGDPMKAMEERFK